MPYLWTFLIAATACLVFYGDFERLDGLLKAAAAVSGAVFAAGFYSRVSLWSNRPSESEDSASVTPLSLLSRFFSIDCFFAMRLYRQDRLRGIILLLTIWSFLTLFAGTVMKSFEYTLSADLTSSVAFSLAMDIAGLVLFITCLFYLVRRLLDREARSITAKGDYFVLAAFLLIVLTGFMLEGARLALEHDPEAAWSPVGLLASNAVHLVRRDDYTGFIDFLYKLHGFLVFAFIAGIPFSKQFHMFTAQVITHEAKKRSGRRERLMHE